MTRDMKGLWMNGTGANNKNRGRAQIAPVPRMSLLSTLGMAYRNLVDWFLDY